MSLVINTLYAALTWMAAFVIGFEGAWWLLGWGLAVAAALQTFAVLDTAVNE